jgi:hypothetical protein
MRIKWGDPAYECLVGYAEGDDRGALVGSLEAVMPMADGGPRYLEVTVRADTVEQGKATAEAILRALARHEREQSAPVASDGPEVWPLVIADVEAVWPGEAGPLLISDMRARDALGRERYGVPLQAGNGRDALRDLYEEVLDACAYARQAQEEGVHHAERWAHEVVMLAARLRVALYRRDGR